MKYDGKVVVKLYGKIKSGNGFVVMRFEDGNVQKVALDVFRKTIKKGE